MRLLVALTAALVACGSDPQRDPVEVRWSHWQCLEAADLGEPPRPDPAAAELAGPNEGCPDRFHWCVGPEAALALERWIRRSLRWMRQAHAACGPKPVPDHSGPNQDDGGPP